MRRLFLGFLVCSACGGPEETKTGDTDTDTGPACVDEIPYDGIDQDCDGADLVDADADGFDAEQVGGDDCDDDDAALNPGAADVPYDGVDQDCDGADLVDADGDGDPALVAGGTDCDDADASVLPGAADAVGDGTDQNCDLIDGVDGDTDGFASGASGGTDCNDADPLQNPDATEVWYDGVDQDCDKVCDYDADGDGAVLEGTVVTNGTPCDVIPGPESYAPTDCDDANPAVGELWVAGSSPLDGAQDVAIAAPILVQLSAVDPTATLTLTDAAGVAVPGTSSAYDLFVTFVPDAPLAFDTQYDLHLTYGCGTADFLFRTEFEPVPVDPADVSGRTYDADIGHGLWVEPAGIVDLLSIYLEGAGILVDVLAADADSLDLRLASSLYGAQDLCAESVDASDVSFANPAFTVPIEPFSLSIYGVYAPVEDASLSAQFVPGALDEVAFSGALDTRELGDLFGLGSYPSAMCDLFMAFGVECFPCLDGGPYCMPLRVEDVPTLEVAFDTVPRTADDIAADPLCP